MRRSRRPSHPTRTKQATFSSNADETRGFLLHRRRRHRDSRLRDTWFCYRFLHVFCISFSSSQICGSSSPPSTSFLVPGCTPLQLSQTVPQFLIILFSAWELEGQQRMEALRVSYGSDMSSDSDDSPRASQNTNCAQRPISNAIEPINLPPPPANLLQPQHYLDLTTFKGNRIRSFPHVQGNYGLHIFIPVRIPFINRKQIASAIKIMSSFVPDLYVVDVDIGVNDLCKDEEQFEQLILGREFHISLGRPVPINVHQIDSIVTMLRQRLQFQRRYWMEFNKWDVFVNDELTRSFLSLEVTGHGLVEISRQISIVDEVYRLHGLPKFHKNPRPHISVAWALGDVSNLLKPEAEELNKFRNHVGPSGRHIFTFNFSGIECRVGKKLHTVLRFDN